MPCHRAARARAGLLFLATVAAACARTPTTGGEAISSARLDGAVARGLGFLRGRREDPSALIVLDYLERKYGSLARLDAAPSRDGETPRAWAGLVGDARRFDPKGLGPLTASASVETVVEHALYCDRAPLPRTFVELLRGFSARGDYELTHTALALALARENGCFVDEVAAAALEASLRERIRALVRRPTDPRFEKLDVKYEGLAVLEDLMGDRADLTVDLARVLDEQQSDGGWRPAPDLPSAPHPTALASWALLAWRYPDAPHVRFAPADAH